MQKKLLDTSGTESERGMRLLSLLFPADRMAEHPDPREYFPPVTESSSPENVGRQGAALGARAGISAWLGTVTRPTLLVVGDHDILSPPENSFFIGERIPSAWVVQVRGAGHRHMYQYPDELTAIVRTIFEQAR